MQAFAEIFAVLPDPRASNARHDLIEILFIAVAATLCGAKSCTDMGAVRPSQGAHVADLSAARQWPALARHVLCRVSAAGPGRVHAGVWPFRGHRRGGTQWSAHHRH